MEDTRVTDGRITSGHTYCSGGAFTYFPSTGRLGLYRSITSVRDGKFIPGKWRFNPTSILSYECDPGGTEKVQWQWTPTPFYVEGHLAFAGWANTGLNQNTILNWALPTGMVPLSTMKAFDKLKSAEFELGLFVGELQETIQMLRNPMSSLRKLYNNWFMASTAKRGIDLTSALSGTWLEFRYGIMPLVSDITAIINNASKILQRDIGLVRFKGRVYSGDSTYQESYGVYCYPLKGSGIKTSVQRVNTNTHLGATFVQQTNDWLFFVSKYGLLPTDLVTIGYELIPYSFVLDWFIDVGSWLNAVLPQLRYDIIGSGYTITGEREEKYVCKSLTYGSYWVVPPFKEVVTLRWRKHIRVNGAQVPALPVPYVNMSSWKRQLDAIALIWQKYPKGQIYKVLNLIRR